MPLNLPITPAFSDGFLGRCRGEKPRRITGACQRHHFPVLIFCKPPGGGRCFFGTGVVPSQSREFTINHGDLICWKTIFWHQTGAISPPRCHHQQRQRSGHQKHDHSGGLAFLETGGFHVKQLGGFWDPPFEKTPKGYMVPAKSRWLRSLLRMSSGARYQRAVSLSLASPGRRRPRWRSLLNRTRWINVYGKVMSLRFGCLMVDTSRNSIAICQAAT